MALAPLIIRWGAGTSSDFLRQSARCTCCGRKGADLQHPSLSRAMENCPPRRQQELPPPRLAEESEDGSRHESLENRSWIEDPRGHLMKTPDDVAEMLRLRTCGWGIKRICTGARLQPPYGEGVRGGGRREAV